MEDKLSPEEIKRQLDKIDAIIEQKLLSIETLKELKKSIMYNKSDYYIVADNSLGRKHFRLIDTSNADQIFYGTTSELKKYISRKDIKDKIGNYHLFFKK